MDTTTQEKKPHRRATATETDPAIITEVCRFAFEDHYEAAGLIDISKNTIRSVLTNGDILDHAVCRGGETDYREYLDKLIKKRAADETARELLTSLYPEKLVPLLKKDKSFRLRCNIKDFYGEPSCKLIDCAFFSNDESRIILLVTDVQEEEEVRERLREAAASAQEANHAKSAFLANMSHEIRTPMNAIVGISEILLTKDLPQEVLMDITTIQNSGSSLLGIINDILDFSKIETGRFEINDTEYMLPSILMDVSNVISVRLSGRPVHFMMDIDPNIPNRMIGDDIRIKQILLNLIGNSVKFTHEGFIELKADGRFLDKETFELVFEVKDSGIGIRKEDFGRLFDTFTQVDTHKNRAITGSGLGLSISKNLAMMMGGDLTVDSVYGRGSTFTVRILQKVDQYEKIGEVQDKSVKILVCEQNQTILHSLRRTLKKLGLTYEICREPHRLRDYTGFTHVLIRRKAFGNLREKLEFMFEKQNIYLILENDEHAVGIYMKYKQLQLPLLCMQLINALNGTEIVTSLKKKSFDRSQITPLTFAKALVVDDNATNLQVAQGLLAPYKMSVDVAASGFKAIELAKINHYDIIFMDHMMPEMDGIEATQHIRELPVDYCRIVPIIALTANAMSGAKEMFLSSGMDDFVAKPIEMTELNRVLKKFVLPKAPEGYLDRIHRARSNEAGAGEMDASGFTVSPEVGADLSSFGPAGVSTGAVQGSVLQQLLAQNNALLSQNMLLLKHLLGEAAAPGISGGSLHHTAPAEEASSSREQAPQIMAPLTEAPSDPELSEPYEHIPGVDMQQSIETYGGSLKIYHNILKTYYYDIQQRGPELDRLYESRDLKNFTISVHAVKGASRGAGANELGEAAFRLEKAGRAEDMETITKLYPDFRRQLSAMTENVGKYVENYLLPDNKEKAELLEEFPEDIVSSLKAACADMDYLTAEELLKKLDRFNYPEETAAKLRELLSCCSAFEYDKLEEMIQSL